MTESMRLEVEAAAHWLSATFIPGVDEADLKDHFSQQLQAYAAAAAASAASHCSAPTRRGRTAQLAPSDGRNVHARLQEFLYAHFNGHWYVEEPHRGCAFRSLTYAPPLVDSLLMRAAEGAGVRDAAFGSAQARGETDFLLWVRAPPVPADPPPHPPPTPCALWVAGLNEATTLTPGRSTLGK